MSPYAAQASHTAPGFPRVSGDEPEGKVLPRIVEQFSPRERG